MLMKVTTAGEWFCVTDGGVALICDNAILGLEINAVKRERENFKKKRRNTRSKKVKAPLTVPSL